MENNYDKWSREELLYEVKRLSVELEKVKQLKRRYRRLERVV